ncbi:MAG: MHYT domain-containing protein, partial [Gammaproteobacteria bacterium]|nr:MHYT domain-containing protein [Gammaproteobacteria bacterium]
MNFWRLVSPDHFQEAALHGHHIHWLCLVAALLAILAASVLLPVTDRFHSGNARHRYWWLAVGSIAMGTGIWAMHFTGMLAFSLPVPIRYDIYLTVLSVIPAIVASGCCILLFSPKKYSLKRLHLSALLLAVGIGTMHYTGMEAMIVPADMYYIPSFFLLSIVAAYLLALIGLFARIRLNEYLPVPPFLATLIGSAILGLAVSSMHFIAMHSTYFQPNASSQIIEHSIPPLGLVIGIISITIVLVGMIMVGTLVDRYMTYMSNLLKKSELRFRRLAETTQTAIFTFNERAITYANPALSKITGYDQTQLLELPLAEIFSEEFNQFTNEILQTHSSFGQAYYEQFEVPTANGDTCWLYFSLTLAVIDGEVTGLASACDISEQKSAEQNLRRLAYRDQLTQLANRALFMDRLSHHLEVLKRRDHSRSSFVMLLDLDEFKMINDTYGHVQGDYLLFETAARLQSLARSSDTIARLGGDEFVLLVEELESELSISVVAER